MKALCLLMALYSALYSAPAWSEWWTDDPERNALMLTSNAALAVDWLQTREIAVNPAYRETNPVLGNTPSMGDVNLYFAGVFIAHNLIGAALPDRWAKLWYGGVIMLEFDAIGHNHAIGIRMRF